MMFKPVQQKAQQTGVLSATEIANVLKQAAQPSATLMAPPWVQDREHGEFASHHLGQGVDFEETRAYQPGDDVRHLNWRLYARTADPYMNVYREEKRPAYYLLIDRRQNMRFATRTRLKLAQALLACAYLLVRAQQQHAVVHPFWLDQRLQRSEAVKANLDRLALVQDWAGPYPPLWQAEQSLDLNHALRQFSEQVPEGALCFLISDFHDYDTVGQNIWSFLSRRCQTAVIQITDKAEWQLPRLGNLPLRSGSEIVTVNTDDALVRNDYAHSFEQRQTRFKEVLQQSGIPQVSLYCHEDSTSLCERLRVLC